MSLSSRLLTIDVGNSQTVFGLFEGKTLRWVRRVETGKAIRLFQKIRLRRGDGVAVASVVPPLDRRLVRLLRKKFGRPPLFVSHRLKLPIRIRLKNPAQVGADRIANAVAAFVRFGNTRPLLIIDFGTATTFDVVTAKGGFIGGAGLPGLGTAAEALATRCTKLPRVSPARPRRVIGRDTREAILSGIVLGHAALVDGMVARISREIRRRPRVIATGGFARLVAPLTRSARTICPHLTLEGLRLSALSF